MKWVWKRDVEDELFTLSPVKLVIELRITSHNENTISCRMHFCLL